MKIYSSSLAILIVVLPYLFTSHNSGFEDGPDMAKAAIISVSSHHNDITIRLQGRKSVYGETLGKVSSENGKAILEAKLVDNGFYELIIKSGEIDEEFELYLEDGDSVQIEITTDALLINGTRGEINKVLYAIHKGTEKYPAFKGNSLQYFERSPEFYEDKKLLLGQLQEEIDLTKQERSLVKEFMFYEYNAVLIGPVKWDDRLSLDTLKNFYPTVSYEDLNRDEFFYSRGYEYSLAWYTRFVFSEYEDKFSQEHLRSEINRIKTYRRSLQPYLLTALCFEYSKNLLPSNVVPFKNLVDSVEAMVGNKQHYQDKIVEIKHRLRNLSTIIPDSISSMKLLSKVSTEVNLAEILSSDNEIIIVDVWASWCSPCIQDMQETFEFRHRVEKEYNVKWVYLSVDRDKAKWRNKMNEIPLLKESKNTYLIHDPKIKTYGDYFNMYQLPQYMMISPDGELILDNLPKPRKEAIFVRALEDYKSNY